MSDTNVMLTTVDNPFNPFTQFDDWYVYDEQMGYHSCSYLARIAKSSSELSDNIQSSIINEAVHEIANYKFSGIHIEVTKENFNTVIAEARKRFGL